MFNDNVGLYFFSALFQGNMALVGLVGIFLIYRLQTVSSEIRDKDNQAIIFAQAFYDRIVTIKGKLPLMSLNAIDLHREIEKYCNDPYEPTIKARSQELLRNDAFNIIHADRRQFQEAKDDLRKTVRRPIYWTLGVIVSSLIMLEIIYPIHQYNQVVELILMSAVGAANIWALTLTTKFMIRSIG